MNIIETICKKAGYTKQRSKKMNIIETICKKAGYSNETISMIIDHAEKMEKNPLNVPFDENGRFFMELSPEISGRKNAEDLLKSCNSVQDFFIKPEIEIYGCWNHDGYSGTKELVFKISVSNTSFAGLQKHGIDWNFKFHVTPEDIIKNRISIPGLKIEMKAIKFLQKYGIASKEAIDEYNKGNCGKTERFFCISKNPIDFIMASTDQSFTSCLSFDSIYQRSYYLSLPAMIADTNRYICYVTDKKIQSYQIFDLEIEHYRYQQRNWLLADINGNVFVDHYYPANIYDVSDILEDIGLSESGFRFSKTVEFDTGRFNSRLFVKPMIYLDNLGIELTENETWRYTGAKRDQGELAPDFQIGKIFIDFSGKVDDYRVTESQKRRARCYNCNCTITSNDDYEEYNGNIYCDDCYNNLTICSNCGGICDDDYYTQDGEHICSNCLQRFYAFCDYCDKYYKKSGMTETENHGYVCDYHLHRLFAFCDVCQKWHKIDESVFVYLDHEQEYVCQDCVAGYAVQCINCKSWHKKEKAIKILSPAEYANDYYCYSCHVFRHASCDLLFEAA